MEEVDGPVNITMAGNGLDSMDFEVTLLEPRPFRPFKSSEEYLYAMKEDLAEWLNGLYEGLDLDADNFLEQMETGVILCQHANNVVRRAREYYSRGNVPRPGDPPIPDRDVVYRHDVLPETFHARDNVSNFISWCRRLRIKECLLFETDDLVLRKNERSFILCLLEVARRGVQFGMPAPLLIQLEQEIDAEIANDDDGYETMLVRQPQVVTNDLRSLHERVVELLSRCTCPSQFPMIRVADGKYRIGDTKVLIFVRILRSHVMVRVGGGWDTLEHYLDKHDPCRCRSGHRLATSAKLTMTSGKSSIPSMHVTYNRPSQAPSSTPSSPQNTRRSLAYTSPTPGRRCHHASASPPSTLRSIPPPPPPGSDDSSTSSLQDTLERKANSKVTNDSMERKTSLKNRRNSAGNSSSEEEEDVSENESNNRRASRRRIVRRELVLRDTVPSSWRYSPGIPRKEYPHQVAFGSGQQRKLSEINSRLPSLTPRSELKPAPKVGKVSPRPHYQQNWNDHRSQSSEDLFQAPASGPVHPQKNLVFHSRGPSPVNIKGRNYAEKMSLMDGSSFRRNDPKRHSSPRINLRTEKTRLSPPKLPPVNSTRRTAVQNGNPPARRMFWSPERQQKPMLVTRKNSEPCPEVSSPVLEKLLQHSELCSDKNFLMKIEQLIAEFQQSTKMDDLENFGQVPYSSLPLNGKDTDDLKPATFPRRSPVENNNGKSPSKIPLPTWYPKCHN
ncbi:GAS2-like protein 1 [Uloborus diversus]|uniref:GAS2-like protein 1 n=1 Tax=Uloborus diversus TaxID=327109 RepID=UPI00240A870C|nr:GAS2-like protein 1 [Uloborus diversus]